MLIRKYFFLLLIFLFSGFLFSCSNNNTGQGNENHEGEIQTVRVMFFNESNHYVIVHRDSFYGPIITEVNTINRESFAFVRPSDNNGVGSIFAIEYIIYPVNDDIKDENDKIFVSCYDVNIQIKKIIIVGEPCTIQIPQPVNLVCKSAFIKIINTHDLPVELRYVGRVIKQADNITIPIAPYQQGLYKLNGIPDEGENCQYYNIVSTFESSYFSNFVSQNGIYITKNEYIFHYTFNGTSIVKTGEQKIVFNTGGSK